MATRTWTGASTGNFATAGNWEPSGVPANSDELIFDGSTSNVDCTLGLSTVLTGLAIRVRQSFTGKIGLIAAGVYSYLTIDGGTLTVGEDTGGTTSGTGSGRIMVNFGSTAGVANILNSSSLGSTAGLPPILLKGTSLTVNATGGLFGVAAEPGSSSTLTALNTTDGPAQLLPTAFLGSGVTSTAITASSGAINSFSANTTTTATLSGTATMTHQGSGAITTANIGAGSTFRHFGSGNVTTVNNSGTIDRTGSTSTVTITNANAYAGSRWLLDNGKASSTVRTNRTLLNCRVQDTTITLPVGEFF